MGIGPEVAPAPARAPAAAPAPAPAPTPLAPVPLPAASGATPLIVGHAEDRAEAEADRAADLALSRLRRLESGSRPAEDSGEPHAHGPGCDHLRRSLGASRGPVVGREGGHLDDDTSAAITSRRGSGRQLDADVRRRMESAFGTGLSNVRIHTDEVAADLNSAVSARAFTTGSDIFFGRGQYQPSTAAGERVLAHELAHTLQHDSPAASSRASSLRRKVGFELELELDLRKPKKVGRDVDERTPLLQPHDKDSGEPAKPNVSPKQDIRKGQTIEKSAGWRLTPDGGGEKWIPEFITDAIDETKSPERPAEILESIQKYVVDNWSDIKPGKYRPLSGGFIVGKTDPAPPSDLAANFHFTLGVRPDRIPLLMAKLTGKQAGMENEHERDEDSDEDWDEDSERRVDPYRFPIDKETRKILTRAGNFGASSSKDGTYRGLVGLMGTYIAGEQRITKAKHAELSKRIKHCIDADDLEEYLRSGELDDRSVRYIEEKFGEGGRGAFDAALRAELENLAPSTVKLLLPLLSRSSLAILRAQTDIPAKDAFYADVAAAAGIHVDRLDERLFPLGVAAPHQKRTVEADPNITIAAWIESVLDGKNLTFADEVKSFEKVGPGSSGWLCCGNARASGAVIEVRALDADRLITPDKWPDVARTVVAMMNEVNAAD